jgi:hypothetical protein
MKPSSSAPRGYSKDSIPLARRFLRFRRLQAASLMAVKLSSDYDWCANPHSVITAGV